MDRPGGATAPRSLPDFLISVALLVLTVVLGAGAAVIGLFLLAFLDHCPPPACSVPGAVNSVITAVLAAGVIGVTGLVLTVVQLIRRKPAWPFGLATFVLCALAVFLGGVGFSAATG